MLIPYLDEKTIQNRVKELAAQINSYYAPVQENILVIGVLNGAFIFLADLVRQLNFSLEIDFIRVSSYGDETISRGTVELKSAPEIPISGRHVLIVEDIIDTGYSMKFLQEYFHQQGAVDVASVVLLDKSSRRVAKVTCSLIGFDVENHFLAGYGLDGAQSLRQIPYIGYLQE